MTITSLGCFNNETSMRNEKSFVSSAPSRYGEFDGFDTLDDFTNFSIFSASIKGNNKIKRRTSPYIVEDQRKHLGNVTARTFCENKKPNFQSSFLLAGNIYKVSSDKLNNKQQKSMKKSVLTLPNKPLPVPKESTVSDMNDSEYFETNSVITAKREKGPRKRRPQKRFQFNERDAKLYSQTNTDVNSSSTEMMKSLVGDFKKNSKSKSSKPLISVNGYNCEFSAHNVWGMLRDMNRFNFESSPPGSEESIAIKKKKKGFKPKRNNPKDTRIIETYTEELAFISNVDPSDSYSSVSFARPSFDRITVIDNKSNKVKTSKHFEKDFKKSNKQVTRANKFDKSPGLTFQGKQKRVIKSIKGNEENIGNNSNKNKKPNSLKINESLESFPSSKNKDPLKDSKTDEEEPIYLNEDHKEADKLYNSNAPSAKKTLDGKLSLNPQNKGLSKEILRNASPQIIGGNTTKNRQGNISRKKVVPFRSPRSSTNNFISHKSNITDMTRQPRSPEIDYIVPKSAMTDVNRLLRSPESEFIKPKSNLSDLNRRINCKEILRNASPQIIGGNTTKNRQDNTSRKKVVPFRSPRSSTNNFISHKSNITDMTRQPRSPEIDYIVPKSAMTDVNRLLRSPESEFIKPKSNITDLKRRINCIRFPLIILGKDEVSSEIKIADYEPTQFYGLDKQIWPFMTKWLGKSRNNNKKNRASLVNSETRKITATTYGIKKALERHNELHSKNTQNDVFTKNQRKNEEKVSGETRNITATTYGIKKALERHNELHSKRTQNDVFTKNHRKNEENVSGENSHHESLKNETKLRPVKQLKEKMMHLLYKNSSIKVLPDHIEKSDREDIKVNNIPRKKHKTDVGTETENDLEQILKFIETRTFSQTAIMKSTTTASIKSFKKKPFYRPSWTSDLIENVIDKVKRGVYYSFNSKDNVKKAIKATKTEELKEYEEFKNIATITTESKNIKLNNNDTGKTQKNTSVVPRFALSPEDLQNLPGFDDSLPVLEIKYLNCKQIAIRHCEANVTIHFDVSVPRSPEKYTLSSKNSSCISLTFTGSKDKIFKCKATLLNPTLPAELCSILPKVLRNLVKSVDVKSVNESPVLPVMNKSNSNLPTISEIYHSANTTYYASSIMPRLHALTFMSKAIIKLLNGRFQYFDIKQLKQPLHTQGNCKITCEKHWPLAQTLMAKLNLFKNFVFVTPIHRNVKCNNTNVLTQPSLEITKTEMALSQSACCTKQVSIRFANVNLFKIFENVIKKDMGFYTSAYIYSFNLAILNNKASVEILMKNKEDNTKETKVQIRDIDLDSIRNRIALQNANKTKQLALENVDYIDKYAENKISMTRICSNFKSKRKGPFVKLYKKCNTTTSNKTKKCSTSLNRIYDLEDFSKLLGSRKLFTEVLEGALGNKIMSAISEMKSWITEITPRQALLVMLLGNMEETVCLSQLRSMLLHGIAVNRITTASELNMEFELKRREQSFIKLKRNNSYESPLPPSSENRDNLMEELWRIAQNTATDYHLPFDEASENLLRSLLEKRKNQNPSYLRVMARFVGLGLLKSLSKR